MNRNQREIYCFIYDDNKHFYRATQQRNGSWSVSKNNQMYPIKHNPRNLIDTPVEFATNRLYFSMNRSINYPLEFTFDGAAILNSKYLNGKGVNENLYFAIFEFDGSDGIYKLSYNGRFDFQQKERDEKIATFTVPVVDDSAWGIISQNDDVEFAIDCSSTNPKAIKVLFDNFTLYNRFTYQTVNAPISCFNSNLTHAIPFVKIVEDGDSFGLITRSQTGEDISNFITHSQSSTNYFLSTFYQVNNINIKGSIKFSWSTNNLPSGGIRIYFYSSTGQIFIVFPQQNNLIPGNIYDIPFDITLNLAPGEKLFFFVDLADNAARQFTINPIVTNIYVTANTKADTTVCYALRPLDLIKDIVRKSTLERYTIESEYFTVNNKTVLIPAESLRGVQNSKIYTSFRDFFESYSAMFFMALRVSNGSLFMELADEVYKRGSDIIDLGDLIECSTSPATEYYYNQIEVGSPKQDYRRPSGRLEFNGTNTFSVPFTNIKNKLSLVSKYRRDCYGMIFLILDYKGDSTKDNSGDNSVFMVDITDELGTANEDIETFENFTVNNSPLSPIIKHPLNGDVIHNDKPFLKGIGIPGTNVNIYIFDVLDGSATVGVDGTWSYQILSSLPSYDPGVFDGIAVINASNTDLSAPIDTIQLVIDTTTTAPKLISYPKNLDSLYNNIPLIKGTAVPGTNINVSLNGVFVAAVVADNSCRWEYKFSSPIPNGSNTIDIGGGVSSLITVNSFVEYPLITFIGSELDGFPIINNLPLVKGVAKPGTTVQIWLNYISYTSLGSAVADSNGNWSIQTIFTTYLDPLSGLPVTVAPIQNGANILSTLLVNNSVKVGVTGYKLNRPAYTSITGVIDNTVFNTRLSPMNAMLNHRSLLSALMDKQRNDAIRFEIPDKNSNLSVVLNGVSIYERADITASSLGAPIARLEYAKVKTKSRRRFAEILNNFNSGGTVKGRFKGKDLYMLPIGSMKMKSIIDDVQEWKLLISPLTTYSNLLNLYKNGLTINLMQNSLFHSDYNPLHFVEYNYTLPEKYNFKTIYQDWFNNRNDAWLTNPDYIQKFNKTDVIKDQIITNGLGTVLLKIYDCKNGYLQATLQYEPVNPAPIPPPEIVSQVEIDWNDYPEGQYFCVIQQGDNILGISERIETRVKWKNTIFIESTNSTNMPGVFFADGFKCAIRVEGIVKKLRPDITVVSAKEESGNVKILYSNLSKIRTIRYGTAQGLPDYLGIKCSYAVCLDSCQVEGVFYSMIDGDNITISEDAEGVPMHYYEVTMALQDNSKGKVFAGEPGANTEGVIVTVDASAIGIPGHSLIDIREQ